MNVNGVKTAYGSDPNNAADNGLGHPVVLKVKGVQRIYELILDVEAVRGGNFRQLYRLKFEVAGPQALGRLMAPSDGDAAGIEPIAS